jgi:putative hydrolase of the HAD superfamily
MKYNGILLDIDDTLYNYDITHKIALDEVFLFCKNKFGIEKSEFFQAYNKARKTTHINLKESASSHNRLLYFQNMLEILKLNPLMDAFEIYNIYWDTFLRNMKVYDGVYEFLELCKDKICLVTDLTAHIQYRKVEKLKLEKYCKNIVTSEEAGKEKPHPYIFMLALQKLNLQANEVCMIGDSFKKDIFGASNLGIQSFWLNKEGKQEHYNDELIIEFKNFMELKEYL